MRTKDNFDWVAKAADKSRYAMSVVKVEIVNNTRLAIATDGHQLRIATVDETYREGYYSTIREFKGTDCPFPNWQRVVPTPSNNPFVVTIKTSELSALIAKIQMKGHVINPKFLTGMDGDWQLSFLTEPTPLLFVAQNRAAIIAPIKVEELTWTTNKRLHVPGFEAVEKEG